MLLIFNFLYIMFVFLFLFIYTNPATGCYMNKTILCITEAWQVERKLAEIKTHKASGLDDIPNWFLEEMSVFIAEPICAIFNASVKRSPVPDIWKIAEVVPVPKVTAPKSIQNDLRPTAYCLLLCAKSWRLSLAFMDIGRYWP